MLIWWFCLDQMQSMYGGGPAQEDKCELFVSFWVHSDGDPAGALPDWNQRCLYFTCDQNKFFIFVLRTSPAPIKEVGEHLCRLFVEPARYEAFILQSVHSAFPESNTLKCVQCYSFSCCHSSSVKGSNLALLSLSSLCLLFACAAVCVCNPSPLLRSVATQTLPQPHVLTNAASKDN